jgi:DhnA family fructose-bisphosphate aldolase class Ia
MESGKSLKLRRFFRHKRTVIIPMDHSMYSGPVTGLEDPGKMLRLVAGTDADGTIVSPWVMRRLAGDMGQLAIAVRLDGGNSSLGQRVDELANILSVESAAQFGAEMIAINVFIGGENESTMIQKLGATSAACDRWGVPLLAEMIPSIAVEHHYGKTGGNNGDISAAVAVASRMGAEYGGDMIKTVYSGNKAELAHLIETTTIPVVIAGGPKTATTEEFLAMVKDCMDAGAAGVAIGRNVWQRPRVEGMIAALCAIVHDDCPVAEAIRLL